MCKIWDREVLQCPYSPDLAPCDCWLLAHVKEHLWGKRFEAENGFNAAVTYSLHCPSKDNYTAAADHLPCRWEMFVGNAIDCIE